MPDETRDGIPTHAQGRKGDPHRPTWRKEEAAKFRQNAPLRDVIELSGKRRNEETLFVVGSPGPGLHAAVRGVAVGRAGTELEGVRPQNGRHCHWVCVAPRAKKYQSEVDGRAKNWTRVYALVLI